MSKHIFGIEINSVEESISLNIDSLCMMPTSTKASPIDDYYKHTDTLVQKSIHPEIKDDAILIRLILLGIVSATEAKASALLAEVGLSERYPPHSPHSMDPASWNIRRKIDAMHQVKDLFDRASSAKKLYTVIYHKTKITRCPL